MGESAMVGEAERRAANAAEHVEVGSLGGERERERGQSGLAVEPGASQASAGQEVSDGFQVVRGILSQSNSSQCNAAQRGGASRVKASGTTVISAGSVPSSSPSASM